jgi:ketosteroid isomerase-like protein
VNDDERRERNKEIVRWVYTHLEERASQSVEQMKEYLGEGAVMELPYGGGTRTAPTFEERLQVLRDTVDRFSSWSHTNMVFHDCVDADEIIWEADAEATFRYSGASYPQRYVMFVKMRDFKIVEAKEYFNTSIMHLFAENEAAKQQMSNDAT